MMKLLVVLAAAICCTYAAVECTLGNPSKCESEAQILRDRLVEISRAYNETDVEGLGAVFTADAKFLLPGAPIAEGRDAIVDMLLWDKANFPKVNFENQDAIITKSDYAIVHNIIKQFDNDDNVLYEGKDVVVFKKIGDIWYVHWAIFNSDTLCPECNLAA